MLIPFTQLLADARAGGYAVGYFEAWDLYSLEAVAEAAEAENAPVILGIGGVMMDPGWFDGGGLERLAAAGLATAQMARVPTAFILNEVATFSQIMRGIRAGFNAVMLDSTALPYAEHARLTRQVVEAAHPIGVAVEAELGALPDGSGELGGEVGHMTDPDEAARFVAETGVDALAVSVGNIHILLDGQSPFDRPRLAALAAGCVGPAGAARRLRLPRRGHPRRVGAGRRQSQLRLGAQARIPRRSGRRGWRAAGTRQLSPGCRLPQAGRCDAAGQRPSAR